MADPAARKQRNGPPGKPFEKGKSGNPAGRPSGLRNRITVLAEQLLAADAEEITRSVIKAAIDGDSTAQRLCFERILPVRKGRPVIVDLPKVSTPADLAAALGKLLERVAEGALTPEEAQSVAGILETQRKAIELVDIEARLSALEQKGERV